MKLTKILLTTSLVMLFSNAAYGNTLDKKQTVINTQNNTVEYIFSDGSTESKALENGSFFIDKNGYTYMNVFCLDDILNTKLEYETENNTLKISCKDSEKSLISFNTLSSYAVTANGNTYVPFRNTMNMLGCNDNEIFYNTADKTISLGKNQIFKTSSVTVSLNSPNLQTKKFDVTDQKSIDLLVGTLNKEPFFETDANIGGGYTYTLDFNNGTVLKIKDNDLTIGKIEINGINANENSCQIAFAAAKEIEDFIRENIPSEITSYQWSYNLSDYELYKKEYITCDYTKNDYGRLINYIKTKITDFDSKYTYYIEKEGSTPYMKFKSKKTGKIYSKQVYEYPAWINRMRVDAFVKSELETD